MPWCAICRFLAKHSSKAGLWQPQLKCWLEVTFKDEFNKYTNQEQNNDIKTDIVFRKNI